VQRRRPGGAPTLLIFDFELGRFAASSWLDSAATDGAADDPRAAFRATLGDLGLLHQTIGLEESSLDLGVARYRHLTEVLASARLQDAGGLVEEIRLVKSAEEIVYMRQAGAVTRRGVRGMLRAVGPNRPAMASNNTRSRCSSNGSNTRALLVMPLMRLLRSVSTASPPRCSGPRRRASGGRSGLAVRCRSYWRMNFWKPFSPVTSPT
jgi:Creatinase/Prolidase N-terminal domain